VFAAITGADRPFFEPAGNACEHYEHFEDDIALLASLGLNTYRFGIEWARIEPKEGEFDAEALEHYRQMLQSCRRQGVTPLVTLHHFSSPRWLIAGGGWESPDTPSRFARYAGHVVSNLSDLILGTNGSPGAICTLNEVNTGRLNSVGHALPDYRREERWVHEAAAAIEVDPSRFTPWTFASSEDAVDVILESHFTAVRAIKEIDDRHSVGLTLASQDIVPSEAKYKPDAVKLCQYLEDRFLSALRDHPSRGDFIGVQSYTHTVVGKRADGSVGEIDPGPDARILQMGYTFAPRSLEACLRHTYELTGMPLIVTESGIGTDNDEERIEYLTSAIEGVANCLADEIPVGGFIAWSLLDNYEWEHGYPPKFGIVAVDRQTQERTPRPSAHWLGRVARS